MKIIFKNDDQKITANYIIRCKTTKLNSTFHISLNSDRVEVFDPGEGIKCYQVDDVNLEDKTNG